MIGSLKSFHFSRFQSSYSEKVMFNTSFTILLLNQNIKNNIYAIREGGKKSLLFTLKNCLFFYVSEQSAFFMKKKHLQNKFTNWG